ncbi:hypothetical protein HanPSC8_Chr17g0780291 [Helianthus annuus]|nr:hypothetical protein HanPSC8_Chr17g0780291 [Helianthus annuus]
MIFKSKIKWVAIGGLALSFVSLLVHMFLANTSAELVQYNVMTGFVEDLNINAAGKQGVASRKLWKKVKSLEALQPYANPRNKYPGNDRSFERDLPQKSNLASVPQNQNNGFIHAKIFGGFEKIRSSASQCYSGHPGDSRKYKFQRHRVHIIYYIQTKTEEHHLFIYFIVESFAIIPCSSEFKSFSYLYNVDHFITSLRSDVIIVKDLPPVLKAARKRKACPIFKPQNSASLDYYIKKVLPKLKQGKLIGLVLVNGGCLQVAAIIPSLSY